MQTWTNAHSLPEIGAFIRATRQAQQLTQQEFSEDLGVSRATLSALENGRAGSSALLIRALNLLGLRLAIVPKSADITVAGNEASR